MQIPKQGERRERELQELVKKCKRPVVLFVDEAHDLNGHTLTVLKRMMEVIEDGDSRLSVVLSGHPKLRNDLRKPTMEEIGYRTDVFNLDGIAGSQHEYIHWLLCECTADKRDISEILTPEAIGALATRLRTPLQIQQHLNFTLDAGYQVGVTPVNAELMESVLMRKIDDLEPTLTCHGYRIKKTWLSSSTPSQLKSKPCLPTSSIPHAQPSCVQSFRWQGCRFKGCVQGGLVKARSVALNAGLTLFKCKSLQLSTEAVTALTSTVAFAAFVAATA